MSPFSAGSLLLTSCGAVYAFGKNDLGQLGLGRFGGEVVWEWEECRWGFLNAFDMYSNLCFTGLRVA